MAYTGTEPDGGIGYVTTEGEDEARGLIARFKRRLKGFIK